MVPVLAPPASPVVLVLDETAGVAVWWLFGLATNFTYSSTPSSSSSSTDDEDTTFGTLLLVFMLPLSRWPVHRTCRFALDLSCDQKWLSGLPPLRHVDCQAPQFGSMAVQAQARPRGFVIEQNDAAHQILA